MKVETQYKNNKAPPYRDFIPNYDTTHNVGNNVDNNSEMANRNNLDESLVGKIDQYYYYPDSDLETIVEESSVMDSDEEKHSGRRSSNTSSLSSLKLNHSPASSNGESLVFATHNSTLSPRQISNNAKSPTSKKYAVGYSLDNSFSPRNSFENESDNNINSDSPNNGASVNPHIQQKIVYAKCLTPRNENAHTPSKQPLTMKDMFEAAKHGNTSVLETFSASELNDTVNEQGNTLLHVAAEFGQLPCLQRLVSTSASGMITLPNDDLMTPTAMAIKNGCIDCVHWLITNTSAREELSLSKRPASIDGSTTRPPVAHVASRFNQVEILDWLCDEMTKDGISMDAVDQCSNTPVHVAARYGHLHCVQTLVSRGASVTVLNSNGDTPIQTAQNHGHTTCVGYLVVVETCVSLAQQLVALRNDMEVLSGENEKLRNGLLAQNVSQNKSKVEPKITEMMNNNVNQEQNNFNSTPRHLKEQPPAPKLWNSSKVQHQKEYVKDSLITPEKQIKNKNVKSSPATKNTALKPGLTERDANDEVKMINKNTSPSKRAWENLTMDEMLKMVRDIRYQPSPSISLCTEDSTMESVEIMRERMAAASRWFLVEKASGGKPVRPKKVQGNSARTLPKNVGNASLQQKISNHYNSTSDDRKPNDSFSPRKKQIGSSQTLPNRVAVHSYTAKSNSSVTPPYKSNPEKHVESTNFGPQQYRNTNGVITNYTPKKMTSPQKKYSPSQHVPRLSNSTEDTPSSTPNAFDSSQRSGSYRKAVTYSKPTKNLTSSSESLSSSSNTDSSNTLRGDISDTHSVASSRGTNHSANEMKSPDKVVYFKPVVSDDSEKTFFPKQTSAKASSAFFGSPSKNHDNQIKRPVPIRSNIFGKKKPKNVAKSPAWSVEKTIRDLATFSPINQKIAEDIEIGEVPELKAELKPRQPSFLRKVEGRYYQY